MYQIIVCLRTITSVVLGHSKADKWMRAKQNKKESFRFTIDLFLLKNRKSEVFCKEICGEKAPHHLPQ